MASHLDDTIVSLGYEMVYISALVANPTQLDHLQLFTVYIKIKLAQLVSFLTS